MEKFVINPEKYKQEYIKNLNTCFGHWGGEEKYEWGFERQIGKHYTDIMLIENKEDGVLAGSAVSYRKLSKEGDSFDIGIMTGSWTLPVARRKGCFSKIIDCSKSLCKEKEVPYLTAFVTETNVSSRRLESAGSHMLPTFHLFSPREKYEFNNKKLPEVEILEHTDELHCHLYQRLQETQKSFLNFEYSPEEFRNQYLNRINETLVVKFNKDFAILEKGRNEVKILVLTHQDKNDFAENLKVLTNWCLEKKGLKSFFFTSRKDIADICVDLGFQNVPGFFTILNTNDDEVNITEKYKDLNINMADKM